MPTVHFYLSDEEYEKVREVAKRLGVKFPRVMRFIIQQYINKDEDGK